MKRFTYSIKSLVCVISLLFLGVITVQAQTVVQDFEGYSIGDSLAHIGWSASDVSAKIADDPLATGNKVLKNTIHNYNAGPVLKFVLPSGKTLANYHSFTFKGYFAQGDVGYKSIVVEAYQTMPTGQFGNNSATSQIGSWYRAQNGSSAWENITVDITNSTTLHDTIYIAFGISCAGTGSIPVAGDTTMWYADNVTLVYLDTTLVSNWGFLGGRIGGWKFTAGSAGAGSIGGDTQATSAWAAFRGQFYTPLTATTSNAVLVTGNIEFVGSGFDTWSGIRYGLFEHDSAGTLITSNVDSTRWSGSESYSHGYMFCPVSGTNRVTDGANGGIGTQWIRVSGNYISTSTGSGPIYTAGTALQHPARAVSTAGVYEFAFSVQPLANGTKEVRFYLIKGTAAASTTSTFYFGGSFIDTSSIAPTYNGVVFALHANDASGSLPKLRAVKVTNVKAVLGTPFTIPIAPWSAYYVDQWGFLGGRIGGWHFIPDPAAVIGNAGIGGDTTATSAWVAIRGGFVEPVTATNAKALLVTGDIEFVGSGFDTWSGIRYGLFEHDSAGTVIIDSSVATLPDSTRWSGSESYSHGYMFCPVSGTNRVTDGANGGIGTQWIRVSGNYISTSTGSGPIYSAGTSVQKPARAVSTAGVYEFAFSVQPLANGTKEVRYYLIKGTAAASKTSTYYFGSSFIDTTSIAPTYNGVVFALHANDASGSLPNLRAVKLTNVKVDIGTPFAIPLAPWSAYYVDQWGFYGNRIANWHYTPAGIVGNATIEGTSANTDMVAIRGGFLESLTPSTTRPLIITGQVQFVAPSAADLNSFRFGIFQSDNPGTLIIDSAVATLPDSTRWNGSEASNSGYLFVPPSGTDGMLSWNGVNPRQGTYGAVVSDVWMNTGGANSYALGHNLQTPANAVVGSGTYNFAISVTPTAVGQNQVRYKLYNGTDYVFSSGTTDPGSSITKFNSIIFALNKSVGTTALTLTNVKIDTGTISGITLTAVENSASAIPKVYALSQNYPNPFNPTTTIQYDLPKASYVRLVVYDLLGRVVANLADGVQAASRYTVQWNANTMSSGVYFYRIDARSQDGSKDFTSVKKLLLMK